MATMQDHPIDLVRAQLARVGKDALRSAGQGALGVATGLALIGLLWLGTLKPADAAGPAPAPGPMIVATAQAQAHAGVSTLRLDGSVLAQTGALATSQSVCRLVIDPAATLPLQAECAAPAVAQTLHVTAM